MAKSISKIKKSKETNRKLITLTDSTSPITEQFRTLRTNINFSYPDRTFKTLLITSSVQQEGKSTVSANLAIVYAQNNTRVLLIDADMRKPTVHNTFGLKNVMGLSTLMTKQSNLSQSIQKTKVPGLDIITSGTVPPNPSELLDSETFDILLKQFQEMYDLIIFDSPPVLSVTDSQIVAAKVDGIIIVVDKQENNKNNIKNAKDLLTVSDNAKILGLVFNNEEFDNERYYVYQ